MNKDTKVESGSVPFSETTTQQNAPRDNKELVIGKITGFDSGGNPLVAFGCHKPRSALSTVSLDPHSIGREVALMFVEQNEDRPVILGIIKSRLDDVLEVTEGDGFDPSESEKPIKHKLAEDVIVDGKRVKFEGSEEVVLKCGESSITLSKSGKISIRGKYLLNRSTGINRILGGAVQIN